MAQKLYVGHLSYNWDNDELQNLFETYGPVASAQIIMDRDTGRSKGFGFVEMASPEDAKSAIAALDGTEVGGRTIKVNEARPKANR